MAWVKLDDAMPHHPKLMAAGPQAFALDVAGICYSNKHATDGFISEAALPAVYPALPSPKRWVKTLVQVGRWVEVDGGWLIHDVQDYQPSAEQQKEISKKRAEAGRRGGSKSGEVRRSNSEATAKQVASTEPNPVPSRPDQEQTSSSDDADASPPEETFDNTVVALTKRLATRVHGNGHKVPRPGTKANREWYVEIDRLLRLDGADPDNVREVIDWSTSDEFWKANIRSAGKLREQFSVLRLRMLNAKPLDVNAATGGLVE